jgi:ATP-dependent exoDNAse (exonuclease V) beta subunit
LGERLRRARQVLCEVPFGLVMSRNELQLDDLAVSEQVVVEGVIDLALREADGWVIGDYKTDLGAVDQRDALVAHYTPQLLNMPAFSRTSLANR